MTRFEPQVGEASTPYWEGTRAQQLVLQWCLDCDQPVHYPRVACPTCLGNRFEYRPASGHGIVHAVVVDHRPPSPFGDDAPYAVALVDLDEGVRMITNVIGCEPHDVTVGTPVRVTWEPLSDGRNLPLFEPRDGSGV